MPLPSLQGPPPAPPSPSPPPPPHPTTASNAVFVESALAAGAAVEHDANRLYDRATTSAQLAAAPLWRGLPPRHILGAWRVLVEKLRRHGDHWSVWTNWYDDVLAGTPRSEAEDAAFTDLPGELPWDDGAEAVNTEVARRLAKLRRDQEPTEIPDHDAASVRMEEQNGSASESSTEVERRPIAEIIPELAEVTSPIPIANSRGQLDVVPNPRFDAPDLADDLPNLPIGQCGVIRIILTGLPRNAPKHLVEALHCYDEELKARGIRPILLLLKDSAAIIAAEVDAPRAEILWLDPGLRTGFDRFFENHMLFMKHFPLDSKRETFYATIPFDQDRAESMDLVKPFRNVAEAAREAHADGKVTDAALAVMDRMTEFVRALPVSPIHGPQPTAEKKRFLLKALGFFVATLGVLSSVASFATVDFSLLMTRLDQAIKMLSSLIH